MSLNSQKPGDEYLMWAHDRYLRDGDCGHPWFRHIGVELLTEEKHEYTVQCVVCLQKLRVTVLCQRIVDEYP